MFVLGNSTFACGVRSARERSFEEASGETEVRKRLLAPEPRPLPPLALAPRTHPRYANRTPTWSSDFRGRYSAWNWTVPVVMLATVVATTATLSSNSCKSASFINAFYLTNSYKLALALRNVRMLHLPSVSRVTENVPTHHRVYCRYSSRLGLWLRLGLRLGLY